MLLYRPQTKFANVMFSQVSVHTGGGGACVYGKGGGAYVAGETATAADGTHPTGMRLRHTFCLIKSHTHVWTNKCRQIISLKMVYLNICGMVVQLPGRRFPW